MGDFLGSFPYSIWARTKHAEKILAIYGANQKSLTPFPVIVLGGVGGITNSIKASLRSWVVPVDGGALGSHPVGVKILEWTADQEDF